MASISNNLDSIDTNILLRIILQDIPKLVNSATNLVFYSPNRLYIDDSVISEAVYVLEKQKKNRKYIVESLSLALENSVFLYDRDLFGQVFPFYLHHSSLSFEDCYLTFKVPRENAAPLWTFDQKFAAQSPTAKALA